MIWRYTSTMYYKSSEFCYSSQDQSGKFIKIYNSAHAKQVFGSDPDNETYKSRNVTYVDICDSAHTPIRRWYKRYDDLADDSQKEAKYLVHNCHDPEFKDILVDLGFNRIKRVKPLRRHHNLLDITE